MKRCRVPVEAFIWLAAVGYALLLLADGVKVPSGFFKPVSIAAALVALAFVAGRTYLWRLPLINPYIVAVPNLSGTWHGDIVSDYKPADGHEIGAIHIRAVIRQTFSSASLRVCSKEMQSVTVACAVEPEPDGDWSMSAVYQSNPRAEVRDRSPIHFGGLRLTISESKTILEGDYWTDRKTTGHMRLTKISGRRLDICPEPCVNPV